MIRSGLMLAAATLSTMSILATSGQAKLSAPEVAPPGHWTELSAPRTIGPGQSALYYSYQIRNGSRVHLVVVDTKSHKVMFKPAMGSSTQTTSQTGAAAGAVAAINGGYFNLSDGDSASYVVIDGKEVANPRNNKALTENPKLAPHLETIFKRTEIRFLEDATGKSMVQIAAHNAAIPEGAKLISSLQGGPRLLPKLEDKTEAFVRQDADGKEADSINGKGNAARTAFGITPDGYAMMVAVAGSGQDPESSGVSLGTLAEVLRRLGCSQAVNLDGGSSSTMWVKFPSPDGTAEAAASANGGTSVCGKSPETKVKSVLLLLPTQGK